ncbi:MAG TPA: hypothetical protein VEN79_14905 [Terriglobia bacterium]|nr:hypothetical protein [Terriglobia bacterium]
MITFIYAAIAIGFLILVFGFLRKPPLDDPDEALTGKSYAPSVGNGRWLDLSERIFDPSDARWLAEELAFPKLAKALILERRRLAIRWLKALQASFDEVVRTPDITSGAAAPAASAGSWRMLWLVIRFKLLVSYALLVVRLFGPYHRLMPSISWIPFSRESEHSFQRAALAHSRSSR